MKRSPIHLDLRTPKYRQRIVDRQASLRRRAALSASTRKHIKVTLANLNHEAKEN